MSTVTITIRSVSSRQTRFETAHRRRRYVSDVLLGTVVETRAIRQLSVGPLEDDRLPRLQAPGDWPREAARQTGAALKRYLVAELSREFASITGLKAAQ